MKQKRAAFHHPVPSIEPERQNQPVEATELPETKITPPALTTLSLPQELLVRRRDGYYSRHWGINE
jgi:hypothetical protein